MRRILRNVVIIGVAVALLAYSIGMIRLYSLRPDSEYTARVVGYLQRGLVTPGDTVRTLRTGAPFQLGYWQVCVSQMGPEPDLLACYNSINDPSVPGDELGLMTIPVGRQVFAMNGSVYHIDYMAEIMPKWLEETLIVLFFGGIVAAWITLAIWVLLDARDRLARPAAAWGLLTLLTGPVGLAVWLVVRGEQPSELCPACGAKRVPGTAFCVHCGRSLDLRCPACGKPVMVGWVHCGTCGASLSAGIGGGENRVLADEDRAG